MAIATCIPAVGAGCVDLLRVLIFIMSEVHKENSSYVLLIMLFASVVIDQSDCYSSE